MKIELGEFFNRKAVVERELQALDSRIDFLEARVTEWVNYSHNITGEFPPKLAAMAEKAERYEEEVLSLYDKRFALRRELKQIRRFLHDNFIENDLPTAKRVQSLYDAQTVSPLRRAGVGRKLNRQTTGWW
jgi:hypothetical protein